MRNPPRKLGALYATAVVEHEHVDEREHVVEHAHGVEREHAVKTKNPI